MVRHKHYIKQTQANPNIWAIVRWHWEVTIPEHTMLLCVPFPPRPRVPAAGWLILTLESAVLHQPELQKARKDSDKTAFPNSTHVCVGMGNSADMKNDTEKPKNHILIAKLRYRLPML